MAELPTYNSSKNINAKASQPLLRGEATREFESAEIVRGAIEGVAQKWSDAHDVMQYTEKKGAYEVSIADIQSRALLDKDFKNSDKYYKELEDAKRLNLDGISNKQVMEKLSMEMDYSNQIAGIKMDADFKQKEIVANKFNLAQAVEELEVKRLSASTPAEAMDINNQISEIISLNVVAGNISLSEGEKMRDAALKTAVQYDIYSDTSTVEEDSQVLADIKDPKGKYPKLNSDDRLSLIKNSQDRIFQNNQTLKREYDIEKKSRIEQIYAKTDAGTLKFSDIDQEMDIPADKGGINNKTLQILRKALRKDLTSKMPQIAEKHEDAVKYIEAMQGYMDNIDNVDKSMEYIAEAYSLGGLSPKEASFLESMQGQLMGIADDRDRAGFMHNNWLPFKDAINAVHDFWTGVPVGRSSEEDHAMTINALIIGITEGKDPIQAKNEAILEAIKRRNPGITNFSKDGQKVIDANGNLKIMFPDGTYKEAPPIKEKPKEYK